MGQETQRYDQAKPGRNERGGAEGGRAKAAGTGRKEHQEEQQEEQAETGPRDQSPEKQFIEQPLMVGWILLPAGHRYRDKAHDENAVPDRDRQPDEVEDKNIAIRHGFSAKFPRHYDVLDGARGARHQYHGEQQYRAPQD